jgi:DNA damage-binding protein 1
MRLQTAIASRVDSPGEMPFSRHRALRTAVRQAEEPFRFVDGELIERFLNIPHDHQQTIVDSLMDKTITVDFVKGMIEELRRMH